MTNTIIVYGLVDTCYPHGKGLAIHEAIAVPNTKDGRALFMKYQEKHSWCGMQINKDIMSINKFEEFNTDKNIELLQVKE